MHLDKLPRILTLQMQRFTLDMATFNRKKLNNKVSFPPLLNMNHFMDDEKVSDYQTTRSLIDENPLHKVHPSEFKAAQIAPKKKSFMAVKNQK